MTIEEAIAFYASRMDEAHAETVENNYARMIEDGLAEDEIEAFRKFEAQSYPAIRAEALAQVRDRLMRDGLTLQ